MAVFSVFLEQVSSNAESFDMMITMLVSVVYIYVAFTAFSSFIRLRKEGILFESKLLYPTGCEMSTCLDEGGYVEFIQPKLLFMGICCVLCLAVEAVAFFMADVLPFWVILIPQVVLPLAMVIYMVIEFRIASKRFW